MSSASGSLLHDEPLSATVYNVIPKVNCVLTTHTQGKGRIALNNYIYITSIPLFTKDQDKRAQNNQLSKASNPFRYCR